MDRDRVARALALMRRDQAPEFLRAIDAFVRAAMMKPAEVHAWRLAVRAKFAELLPPEGEV